MENKETKISIRVETHLGEAFAMAAKGQDRNASQLIREFMREYVKKHGQTDLFKR